MQIRESNMGAGVSKHSKTCIHYICLYLLVLLGSGSSLAINILVVRHTVGTCDFCHYK